MRLSAIFLLSVMCLLAGPGSMPATGSLWAMQAVVPPGTNNTQVTETVTPPETPAAETPAAEAPAPTGTTVVTGNVVQVPAPTGGPGTTGTGGGPPIGADGRSPVLPPGVPQGPAGPGSTRGSGPGSGVSRGGGSSRNAQTPGPGGAVPAGSPSGSSAQSTRVTSGVAAVEKDAASTGTNRIPCNVNLASARTNLSNAGGEFTVAVTLSPAACTPAITPGVAWIRVIDPSAFRFAAEANNTGAVRDAVVSVGEASFFVRQEHAARSGFAAAPSRLVFGLSKKGKADTKRITAWSEKWTGNFTARAGHSWLLVKARKPQPKRKRQAYEVTVLRNSGLGPGRHDTFVELTPAGSATSLRIPVVVEVPGVP